MKEQLPPHHDTFKENDDFDVQAIDRRIAEELAAMEAFEREFDHNDLSPQEVDADLAAKVKEQLGMTYRVKQKDKE